jgi:hypothetical protein
MGKSPCWESQSSQVVALACSCAGRKEEALYRIACVTMLLLGLTVSSAKVDRFITGPEDEGRMETA